MANIDSGGGDGYTPTPPVATGPIPSPGISQELANQIWAMNPSGSATLAPVSYQLPDFKTSQQSAILNDPSLKQQQEWLDQQYKKDSERAAQEAIWWQKDYDLAVAALNSSRGGGYSGEAEQAALDQLAREQAAHNKALAEKQTREVLASRGMADSGQVGFEQGELQYKYDTLLKEIALRAQARQASAAAASSSQNASISNQLANLQLQKEKHDTQVIWNQQDLRDSYVNAQGQLVLKTGEKLAQAWFVPAANGQPGYYAGPGGEVWDVHGVPIGGGVSVNQLLAQPASYFTGGQ
jgi:hypothetical protein